MITTINEFRKYNENNEPWKDISHMKPLKFKEYTFQFDEYDTLGKMTKVNGKLYSRTETYGILNIEDDGKTGPDYYITNGISEYDLPETVREEIGQLCDNVLIALNRYFYYKHTVERMVKPQIDLNQLNKEWQASPDFNIDEIRQSVKQYTEEWDGNKRMAVLNDFSWFIATKLLNTDVDNFEDVYTEAGGVFLHEEFPELKKQYNMIADNFIAKYKL